MERDARAIIQCKKMTSTLDRFFRCAIVAKFVPLLVKRGGLSFEIAAILFLGLSGHLLNSGREMLGRIEVAKLDHGNLAALGPGGGGGQHLLLKFQVFLFCFQLGQNVVGAVKRASLERVGGGQPETIQRFVPGPRFASQPGDRLFLLQDDLDNALGMILRRHLLFTNDDEGAFEHAFGDIELMAQCDRLVTRLLKILEQRRQLRYRFATLNRHGDVAADLAGIDEGAVGLDPIPPR